MKTTAGAAAYARPETNSRALCAESEPSANRPQAAREPEPRRRWLVPVAIVAALVLIAGVAWSAIYGGDRAEAQPLALSFSRGQEQTYVIHQTMDAHMSSDVFGDQPLTMDLGATVCKAGRPACDACPLSRHCASYPKILSMRVLPKQKAARAERVDRFGVPDRIYRGRVIEALRTGPKPSGAFKGYVRVLPGLERPREALLADLAAPAHLLGLFDLENGRPGVADGEEQLRVFVETRGAVAPIHGEELLF